MPENNSYISNNEQDPAKKQKCALINEITEEGIETIIRLKVKSIEEKTAVNGQTYQKLYCRDISGCEATIINWDMTKRVTTDLTKYPFVSNMSIIADLDSSNTFFYRLCSMELLDPSTLDDFEPENHIDPKKAVKYLKYYIATLPPFLKTFVNITLNRIYKPFIVYPLTSNKAFSRRCGILEATCKLLEAVQALAPVFHADPSIMTASAILYYCGYVVTMNRSYALMSGALLGKEAASDILYHSYLKVMKNEEFRTEECELQYRLVRNAISSRHETEYTRENTAVSGTSNLVITIEGELLRHAHEMIMENDYIRENTKSAADHTIVNLQTGSKVFKTSVNVEEKAETENTQENKKE